MNRKKLIFILFLLTNVQIFGQFYKYINISGNYSIISDLKIEKIESNTKTVYSEIYEPKYGFDIFYGINRDISRKFQIELEIGLSNVNYTRNIQNDIYFLGLLSNSVIIYDIDGNQTDHLQSGYKIASDDGLTNIIFLTTSLKFQTYFWKHKCKIGVGVSPSILVHSRRISYKPTNLTSFPNKYSDTINRRWRTDEDITGIPRALINDSIYSDYSPEYEKYVDKSSDGLSNLNFDAIIDFQYKLFNNLWITGEYQKGLMCIYDKNKRIAGDAKNKMIKIGLKYYIKTK